MRNSDFLDQENYLQSLYHPTYEELGVKSRQAAQELGLERISISWPEAQLLGFFVRLFHCEKFVEIGTLTGFSAMAILQALSEKGCLWTFEKNQVHADKARPILDQFIQGGQKKFSLEVGDAVVKLPEIESKGPFDGIFIDGNKAAYGKYLDWAEKNIKKGGVIIADNVFLGGSVWGAPSSTFDEKQIKVMKEFNQRLSDTSRYLSSAVPTSEGLLVAQKLF